MYVSSIIYECIDHAPRDVASFATLAKIYFAHSREPCNAFCRSSLGPSSVANRSQKLASLRSSSSAYVRAALSRKCQCELVVRRRTACRTSGNRSAGGTARCSNCNAGNTPSMGLESQGPRAVSSGGDRSLTITLMRLGTSRNDSLVCVGASSSLYESLVPSRRSSSARKSINPQLRIAQLYR